MVRSLFMAYEDFEKSGFQGFLLAQSWTVKTKTGALWPMYKYEQLEGYLHHNDYGYMYGIEYARGHFEYV